MSSCGHKRYHRSPTPALVILEHRRQPGRHLGHIKCLNLPLPDDGSGRCFPGNSQPPLAPGPPRRPQSLGRPIAVCPLPDSIQSRAQPPLRLALHPAHLLLRCPMVLWLQRSTSPLFYHRGPAVSFGWRVMTAPRREESELERGQRDIGSSAVLPAWGWGSLLAVWGRQAVGPSWGAMGSGSSSSAGPSSPHPVEPAYLASARCPRTLQDLQGPVFLSSA